MLLDILVDLLPPEHHYLLHDSPDGTPTETISLNIVKRYRNHLKPSVRENLQNWRDQCFKQAKDYDPQNSFPSPSIETHLHKDFNGTGISFELYSAWSGEREESRKNLGWLLQTTSKLAKQTHDIIFYNNNVTLGPEILRFGHSDKENEPCLAGHFGDGLKPEINRLLASGASFKIKTGPSTWSFAHDKHDSLFCYVNTNNDLVSSPPATLIHISGIRSKTVRVDPTQYLFLRSNEQLGPVIRYQMPNKRTLVRFLMKDSYVNKIFFHGIYVTQFSVPFPIGLDYNAALSSESGIGVERNTLNSSFIINEMLTTAASMQENKDHGLSNELFNELRYRFYTGLSRMHYGLVIVCLLKKPKIIGEFLFEGFMLSQVLKDKHTHVCQHESPASVLIAHQIIIPMNRQEINEYKDELTLFQCKYVEIQSSQLLQLLRCSPMCPVIDSIRSNFTSQFLSLPEYIIRDDVGLPYPIEIKKIIKATFFPSVEANLHACELRDDMVDLFDDVTVLPKWSIRFKQFPPTKTPKPITPLKIQKFAFYIVDISQFSQFRVHQLCKSEDESYECTGVNCSCVHTYFYEQLMKAIDTVFPASNRKKTVENKLKRLAMSSLSSLTTQRIPTPDPLQSSNTDSSTSGQEPAKGSRPSIHSGHKNTADSHRNPAQQVQLPPRRPTADEAYLEHVVEAAFQCVSVTGTSMADPVADRIFRQARSSQLVIESGYSEAKEEVNLIKNDSYSQRFRQFGLNIALYCHPAQVKALETHIPSAIDLSCIVSLLWRCLYSDSDIKCNVFYDESSVIAFNRAGQVYFNIFYHNKIKDMSVDSILSHWFIVFCHELAHNKIKDHGPEFGALVEHIALTFIPLYAQKVEDMKATLIAQRKQL
ncbi:hypothetical protein GEMRC1_012878 [Eukaryota sp. GEM-RC1]